MKTKISILLTITITLFYSLSSFSQSKNYFKFKDEPTTKLILNDIKTTDFYAECRSKKEATIYFELRKGKKVLGNFVKTLKARKKTTIKMNLNLWAKITPGRGYNYALYMFEGPKNTWDKKVGPGIVIEDIQISRL